MLRNTVSTMPSHSFLVRFVSASDSFSTRSLLVIPVVPPADLLGKIFQSHAVPGHLLVDYSARLLPEQFEEGDLLLRRRDHLRLAGDLPQLRRVGDRVLGVAEDLYQPRVFRLLLPED